MDITLMREIATVASFLAFVGICAWAWSRSRRDTFEQAARMPLEQD